MNEHILIVDDEAELAELLAVYLRNGGFRVTLCGDGACALHCIESEAIDLAILDVMLPDMSGFDICRTIRQQHFFPIIMLTAKIDDNDKIFGLTLGADDYITKPFNPLEVVARVRTQLRRASQYNSAASGEAAEEIDIRGLVINKTTHRCTLYAEPINLTPLEFDILWYLAAHRGRVVPSEELFEAVWQEKYLKNSSNTVMAHIGRLRDKLHEPAKNPKFVKTVWGIGYEIE
ncbi:MAG: VanR-ABDEGLN family response regulator transcription factor [Peptococcaceae bacterium]|nr:VanR-ABDEGLN family response regulator transcription factor [Peptococcaceae bacterium]